MTASDFDQAFGTAAPARGTFAERLGHAKTAPANDDGTEGEAKAAAYRAFGFLPTNTVGDTCDVQRWLEGTEIAEGIEFGYRFLLRLEYVGDEEIRLFLPDCIVVIEGKCLRELRKKLARRQVTFISQYSDRIWPNLPAAGEPIIDRIQVIRP